MDIDHSSRPGRARRGRLAAVGASVTALVAVLASVPAVALTAPAAPDRAASVSRVPTVALPTTTTTPDQPTPRERLRALAEHVRTRGDDRTYRGRYAYVRLSCLGVSGRPGDPAARPILWEERRWRDAATNSGRVMIMPLNSRGPRPSTTDYAPGELADVSLPEPLSDDPPILASAFDDLRRWSLGYVSGMRAIADIHAWHHVTGRVRAAMLEILANTPGLRWDGHRRDSAGRLGAAFFLDSSPAQSPSTGERVTVNRDTVIFDRSGRLLSHEIAEIHGTTVYPVTRVVVLHSWRTDRLG